MGIGKPCGLLIHSVFAALEGSTPSPSAPNCLNFSCEGTPGWAKRICRQRTCRLYWTHSYHSTPPWRQENRERRERNASLLGSKGNTITVGSQYNAMRCDAKREIPGTYFKVRPQPEIWLTSFQLNNLLAFWVRYGFVWVRFFGISFCFQ